MRPLFPETGFLAAWKTVGRIPARPFSMLTAGLPIASMRDRGMAFSPGDFIQGEMPGPFRIWGAYTTKRH